VEVSGVGFVKDPARVCGDSKTVRVVFHNAPNLGRNPFARKLFLICFLPLLGRHEKARRFKGGLVWWGGLNLYSALQLILADCDLTVGRGNVYVVQIVKSLDGHIIICAVFIKLHKVGAPALEVDLKIVGGSRRRLLCYAREGRASVLELLLELSYCLDFVFHNAKNLNRGSLPRKLFLAYFLPLSGIAFCRTVF
jgi:hypothetical protein